VALLLSIVLLSRVTAEEPVLPSSPQAVGPPTLAQTVAWLQGEGLALMIGSGLDDDSVGSNARVRALVVEACVLTFRVEQQLSVQLRPFHFWTATWRVPLKDLSVRGIRFSAASTASLPSQVLLPTTAAGDMYGHI
jgi:hypothetical protein